MDSRASAFFVLTAIIITSEYYFYIHDYLLTRRCRRRRRRTGALLIKPQCCTNFSLGRRLISVVRMYNMVLHHILHIIIHVYTKHSRRHQILGLFLKSCQTSKVQKFEWPFFIFIFFSAVLNNTRARVSKKHIYNTRVLFTDS